MSKLTKEQLTQLHAWAGYPLMRGFARIVAGYNREPCSVLDIEKEITQILNDEPEEGSPETLLWPALPTVNSTPINRLRVLADEIEKVAGELYVNSLPGTGNVFDDAREIREGIGRMIAFAALNTPIKVDHK